ncbi:MAG: flagellar motor protein MotB [Defluviitaleaceae bacterium]|nr:flagellar motor protein MotB [Defluviitaleaceae bacterium]
MAKKKKKQEEGVSAAWMTSYTDLVTVLFALFVMLYALSDVNEEAFADFAEAAARGSRPVPMAVSLAVGGDTSINMQSGITNLPGMGVGFFPIQTSSGWQDFANQNGGRPMTDIEIIEANLRTYFGLDASPGESGTGTGTGSGTGTGTGIGEGMGEFQGNIGINISDAFTITITFGDGMLFNSGSADILPETFPALDFVVQQMMDYPHLDANIIGHTDNIPMSPGNVRFPDNWALSSGRAINVLQYLVYQRGIDPVRVQATGRGETEPVESNSTPQGRQANRRVEIQLINTNPGLE